MVHMTVEAFGRLDVLVNCAGLPDTFIPTVEQTLEHWQRLIDVHLTGTFLMATRAAVAMMRNRHGAIGRASCRARVCQSVKISVVAVTYKKKQTNNTK